MPPRPSLVLLSLGALTYAAPTSARAQTPQESGVAVVHRLFDGMRKGDSAMVRSVFDASVEFLSVSEKDGVPTAAARSGFGSAYAIEISRVPATGAIRQWLAKIFSAA